MILEKYLNRTGNLLAENRLLKTALLIIALSTVCFGWLSYSAVNNRKIIIYPVGYSGHIEIQGERVNREYLAYLSRTVFGLLLNYTPASVKSNYEIILSMIAPRSYSRYRRQFQDFVQEASIGQLISTFLIDRLTFEPSKDMVTAVGSRLFILQGSTVAQQTSETYVMKYAIRNGRFMILEIGQKKDIVQEKKEKKEAS